MISYKLRKLPKIPLYCNGNCQIATTVNLNYPSAQRNITKEQKDTRIIEVTKWGQTARETKLRTISSRSSLVRATVCEAYMACSEDIGYKAFGQLLFQVCALLSVALRPTTSVLLNLHDNRSYELHETR